MNRRQMGFNLVELMVALSIITILSVKASTSYQHAAKRSVAFAQVRALAKQLAAFRDGGGQRYLSEYSNPGRPYSAWGWCNGTGAGLAPNYVSGNWRHFPDELPSTAVIEDKSAKCVNKMNEVWSKVGFAAAPKTPWGGVVMLEENDGEWGLDDCTFAMNDWVIAYDPVAKSAIMAYVPMLKCNTNMWGF
jgi:prepilin-type N-terminal cleavage/methylation domain-containing protein